MNEEILNPQYSDYLSSATSWKLFLLKGTVQPVLGLKFSEFKLNIQTLISRFFNSPGKVKEMLYALDLTKQLATY